MRAPYIDLNPNATIPVITNDKVHVLGDSESLFFFLINSDERVRQIFYPASQVKEIKVMLEWFKTTLRKSTTKLIRTAMSKKQESLIQRYLSEFMTQVCFELDH